MITQLARALALLCLVAIGRSASAVVVTHSTAGELVNTGFEGSDGDTAGLAPTDPPWGEIIQNRNAGAIVEVVDADSPFDPGPHEGSNYLYVERWTAGQSATSSAYFTSQAKLAGSFTLKFASYRTQGSAFLVNWAPQGSSSPAGYLYVSPTGVVNTWYGNLQSVGLTSDTYAWEDWEILFDPTQATPKISVTLDGMSSGPRDTEAPFASFDRVYFHADQYSQFYLDAAVNPEPATLGLLAGTGMLWALRRRRL